MNYYQTIFVKKTLMLGILNINVNTIKTNQEITQKFKHYHPYLLKNNIK